MVQIYYIPVWKKDAKYERRLLTRGMWFVSESESKLQLQQLQSGAVSPEV